MHKISEKGVVHLLVPIILLLGIIAGVYLLVSGNLNLFSKASNPPTVFKSSTGQALSTNSSGFPTSGSPSVKIEFTSTLGGPAATGSSLSRPTTITTKSFRFAEDPNTLSRTAFQAYTKEPMIVDYTFQQPWIGPKFIWVEFLASNGRPDRRSAQIELVPGGTITITPSSCQLKPGQAGCPVNVTYTYSNNVSGGAVLCLGTVAASSERSGSTYTYSKTGYPAGTYPFYLRTPAKVNNQWNCSAKPVGTQLDQKTLVVSPAPTPKPTTTPTPTPTSSPMKVAKRVFVTSTTYNGRFDGSKQADINCQNRANAANLGGTWEAWVSDRWSSPTSKFNKTNVYYVDINYNLIANSWPELTSCSKTSGQLIHYIEVDEFGRYIKRPFYIWTGTTCNGTFIKSNPIAPDNQTVGNCGNWHYALWSGDGGWGTVGAVNGVYSIPMAGSDSWTNYGTMQCGTYQHLYCFEQ